MSKQVFEFGLPFRVVTGEGSLEVLGKYARGLGQKAFLGAGRSALRKAGIVGRAVELLEEAGIAVTLFEGIEPDPSTATVDRGVALARREECDLFVGLGGGSVLDAVKAIAILTRHEGPAREYQMQQRQFSNGCPPVVAIPSTSGTGSEATKVSVLTNEDTGIKKAFYSFDMVARLVVLDPAITARMPWELTAATGLDALGHAIEGYVSTAAVPVSKGAAIEAIRLIGQCLPRVLGDLADLDAREQLAMAAMLGGVALIGSVGTCHEMAMALGSLNKTEHGLAVAFFTVPCLKANRDYCAPQLGEIARALGVDINGMSESAAADAGIDAVAELVRLAGVPESLADLNLSPEDVEEFLRVSKVSTNITTNPRPMDDELRRQILLQCF